MHRSRKKTDRKATQLARLLVQLDALAGEARPWRPRRVRRAALGTGRL
jgi:hypothetical protein